MRVLPENQVMAGWQQGLEETPREDFSTFPCGQTREPLFALLSCFCALAYVCQLTGSSLWCWGSPRNESGVSQLDRPQLDPEGTGFRVAPLSRTASAAEGRGRTYLDHWALFTSGLPLQASQTHAGPFLLRLNRSPPPPHPVLQRGPGQATWVLYIYTPFPPAASCRAKSWLFDATDYIMATNQLPTGQRKWA